MRINRKSNSTLSRVIKFDYQDIKLFAKASGDKNPLHLDALYASNSIFGRRIVFGVLAILATLTEIRPFLRRRQALIKIKVEFKKPVYVGEKYKYNVKSISDNFIVIVILDELVELVDIQLFFSGENSEAMESILHCHCNTRRWGAFKLLARKPLDYDEQDFFDSIQVRSSYSTRFKYVKKLCDKFDIPSVLLQSNYLDILLLCSYVIGMELPGKRALFSGLELDFLSSAKECNPLRYDAVSTHYERKFGLLDVALKINSNEGIVAKGSLYALVRKNAFELVPRNFSSVLGNSTSNKIIIAATFTADPIVESLIFFKKQLGFRFKVKIAPYNQVFQELLNSQSDFLHNRAGMNVILFNFEDWFRYKNQDVDVAYTDELAGDLKGNLAQLQSALTEYSKHVVVPTLFLLCPVRHSNDMRWNKLFNELRIKLFDYLNSFSGITVIFAEEWHNKYEVDQVHEEIQNKIGHIPYTREYFNFLGTLIIRRYCHSYSGLKKVIVLDCDNTLWDGVCGELGSFGVTPYIEFQKFLISQHKKGVLLCLCSKNKAGDVWDVFERNNNMILRKAHIADSQINWQDKSENLQLLANRLNLGLDSFIFIDDNPVECAEIKSSYPEVTVVQFPGDIDKQNNFFNHLWILDHYSVTEEDKNRNTFYRNNVQREKVKERNLSFSDFLKEICVKINFNELNQSNIERASQLTNRTNQFNFTTVRRSVQDLRTILNSADYQCLVVDVTDKFGAYGLVGLLVVKKDNRELVVDTFLLSCRVLSRGVEYNMMSQLGKMAEQMNLKNIKIVFHTTERNQPAKLFLEKIGRKYKFSEDDQQLIYKFPIDYLQGLSYMPEDTSAFLNSRHLGVKKKKTNSANNDLLKDRHHEIFTNFSSAKNISELIRQSLITDKNGVIFLKRVWKENSISSGELLNSKIPSFIIGDNTDKLTKKIKKQISQIRNLTIVNSEDSSLRLVICIRNYCYEGLDIKYPVGGEIYFLHDLIKRLNHSERGVELKILCIYITSDKDVSPETEAVVGLAKSINAENTKLNISVVSIIQGKKKSANKISKIIEAEIQKDQHFDFVRYIDGIEYIQKLEISDGTFAVQKNVLVKGGVYLITGGAGRLGLVIARFLTKMIQANVILVGRSELNEETAATINEIRFLGGNVEYFRVDIANKKEVDLLIKNIEIKYNKFNGIIHAAGALIENRFEKKSIEEIERVIAPKIYGIINLDMATKNKNLDFLLTFSSTAGILGHPNWADYAFANAYMNGFVLAREKLRQQRKRQGITISINWPVWKKDEMMPDQFTQELLTQLYGLTLLNTQEGLEVFVDCLSSEGGEFIVFKGNESKIKHYLTQLNASQIKRETTIPANQINYDPVLYENILRSVRTIFAEQLSLAFDEIHPETSLENLESIKVVMITAELTKKFGDIPITLLFEKKDVRSLVEYIVFNKSNSSKHDTVSSNVVASSVVTDNENVAIIGMSGLLPQSKNLDEFWDYLNSGKNLVTEIPKERWDWREFYGSPLGDSNKTYVKKGGFIHDFNNFDGAFFGLSSRELNFMDPQHRLFLRTAWELIEDAGYKMSDLSGESVGVFAGIMTADYRNLIEGSGFNLKPQTTTGTFSSVLANRVSYLFNFHGPSEIVDTACSSSLVAIHKAVQAINAGDCDLAIAGGVNLILAPELYIAFDKLGVLSKDGQCKSFDKSANGYVRGEGVGTLLLKPLNKAIADKDNIYAVIKGSAVNHGGRTNSLTTPSPAAQAEVIIKAWAKADVDPSTISYIEAHGTGTKLGDPIEIDGLKQAFNELYKRKNKSSVKTHCGVGSVKTNIGHLEAAAGVAGVIKVLLAMKHSRIPKLINFQQLNPYINLNGSPFYIVDQPGEWGFYPFRAGVSSFGFGGVNSHIALEVYQNPTKMKVSNDMEGYLCILSAKSKKALYQYADRLVTFILKNKDNIILENIAYTLQVGREEMKERLAVVASTVDELVVCLNSYLKMEDSTFHAGVYFGSAEQETAEQLSSVKANIVEELFEQPFTRDNLLKFAKLWVKGVSISWKSFLYSNDVRRISLPTYPFEQSVYWLPAAKQELLQYYTPTWKPALDKKVETIKGPILIFSNDKGVAEKLKNLLSIDVILVSKGDCYQRSGSHKYLVSDDLVSYVKLFEQLQKNSKPIKYIIYNAINFCESDKSRAFSQLLILSQALLKCRIGTIDLIYMYLEGSLYDEAMAAFIKTINLECVNYYYRAVSLPVTSDIDFIGNAMFKELGIIESVEEVVYRENVRYEKQVIKVNLDNQTEQEIKFKKNGAYIIIGGAGGLGMIITEYLVEKAQASVIISGRSILDDELIKKIDLLNSTGATIDYIQGDISKIEDAKKLIHDVETRFGHIDGIIYCAGVLNQPSLIVNQSYESLDMVFKSKINGLNNLDEVTKRHSLDWIILCSSIYSVLGGVGLSGYAYANRYIDAFAKSRNRLLELGLRKGKTISINWSSWENGGMQVDEATKEWINSVQGLKPLTKKDGLLGLEMALKVQLTEVMILFGDAKKIERALNHTKERKTSVVASNTKQITNIGLKELLEKDILNLVIAILDFGVEGINVEKDIESYGFDSLSFVDLTNDLNKKYNLSLSPAIMFEHKSISELAAFLAEQYKKELSSYYRIVADAQIYSKKENLAHRAACNHNNAEIAIIGIGGIMPGAADLEEFWDNIRSGKDLIQEIPRERWDWKKYYGDGKNQTRVKWGGFIEDVDCFDARFFKIAPRDAELMDPQQRLFMQVAWSAIEDAGYDPFSLSGKKVGIFVGVQSSDYADLLQDVGLSDEAKAITGTLHCMTANRLSYFLNLHGPSEAIDTACSSSLVAVKHAVDSIKNGDCELAIAGGVNLLLNPKFHIGCDNAGMLSKMGRCKTFDKDAVGYVRSEGVGAILLKPLQKAIADRDHIYGVIKGISVNHGGKANGLTAPNPSAQAALLTDVYTRANISPETVSYIETHGTGTSLGDPIEINGLKKGFDILCKRFELDQQTVSCGLGSVKTNIGHLESAAGIAGLIKTLLAMKHKMLPGLVNFKTINPYIELEDAPFYLVQETIPWKQLRNSTDQPIPRRAGISSFGIGGANAHVIVEEFADTDVKYESLSNDKFIFILSASNEDRLRNHVERLIKYLKLKKDDKSIRDITYTLQVGRASMNERLGIVATNYDDLIFKLDEYLAGNTKFVVKASVNNEQQDSTSLNGDISLPQDFPDSIKSIDQIDLLKLRAAELGVDWQSLLVQLWATGFEIDWQLLPENSQAKRVSLPTYPFAKKRYWIPHRHSE